MESRLSWYEVCDLLDKFKLENSRTPRSIYVCISEGNGCGEWEGQVVFTFENQACLNSITFWGENNHWSFEFHELEFHDLIKEVVSDRNVRDWLIRMKAEAVIRRATDDI